MFLRRKLKLQSGVKGKREVRGIRGFTLLKPIL